MAIYFLITAVLVHAKTHSSFPWKNTRPLPWQITKLDPVQTQTPSTIPNLQSHMPLSMLLSANGAIKITDSSGLIRVRLGLPGRPQKVWRDSGTRVTDIFSAILLPARSPLQKPIENILANILDFRQNLEGLIWILGDDENFLTIINPATSQAVYLPLPAGRGLVIAFHSDRIEILEEQPKEYKKAQTSWSLYWLTLLPQFIQLGKNNNFNQLQDMTILPVTKKR